MLTEPGALLLLETGATSEPLDGPAV